MMRSGPKPLPFQLGMASLASAGLAGGGTFSSQNLQDFFKGIQMYQTHPYKRALPALERFWSAGEATLYNVQKNTSESALDPLVLIPSMVNKSDILDLHPERSLLRWLGKQGFNAYLFDWGTPVEDDLQADFALALTHRLEPALRSLGRPVHLVGYCMGGLFTVAQAAFTPELVKSIVLLACPWNFHDQAGALRARLTLAEPIARPYMTQYHHLPESWMQAIFATLDPEGSIRKFARFAGLPPESRDAELFVAVEDWLNEGVDLPAGIAAMCFQDWYGQNDPFEGRWTVADRVVRAGEIRAPTCVVAARNDKIVPLDSALAFAEQRTKCHTIICDTGHVGLIAGRDAPEKIWRPLADWIRTQQ